MVENILLIIMFTLFIIASIVIACVYAERDFYKTQIVCLEDLISKYEERISELQEIVINNNNLKSLPRTSPIFYIKNGKIQEGTLTNKSFTEQYIWVKDKGSSFEDIRKINEIFTSKEALLKTLL